MPPSEATARRQAEELDLFRQSLEQRRPYATLSLMAVLVGVFALQGFWGGLDLPPLLARMGSLIPERARAGEWWRYFSCSFLHFGALHVGLNLLLLWMLGRFLEPAVGSARFLLIYFLAALAGSLCGSLFVIGQSVGASGGIWGLLGAEVVMAFHPRRLMPALLIPLARRVAVANLLLNLLGSFNPDVDLFAHLGGGLMGALAVLILAAAGRLPTYGSSRRVGHRAPRGAAAGLCCLFGVGLVTAQLHGRPWRLSQLPEMLSVFVAAPGWRLSLPAGLSPADGGGRPGAARFGDLAYDCCAVDITWTESPPSFLAPAQALAELASIRRELETPAPGLDELRPPEVLGVGARRWVSVRYRYSSNPDVIDDRAIGLQQGRLIRVDVLAWEALPRSFEGLAPLILHSISAATAAPAREPPP